MSRLATSFILGYHGCDRAIADKAVRGELELIQSKRDFDWLGNGAYFWESDPLRAQEWAQWKASLGHYKNPTVIGAVIDLRNCLDLMSRDDIELVRYAHRSFLTQQKKAGLKVPKNMSATGQPNMDRVLRYLDCAVIKHLHSVVENIPGVPPFDTVRGMFSEGKKLYAGCGYREKSHVQIAVRSNDCIKGIFYARGV